MPVYALFFIYILLCRKFWITLQSKFSFRSKAESLKELKGLNTVLCSREQIMSVIQ